MNGLQRQRRETAPEVVLTAQWNETMSMMIDGERSTEIG